MVLLSEKIKKIKNGLTVRTPLQTTESGATVVGTCSVSRESSCSDSNKVGKVEHGVSVMAVMFHALVDDRSREVFPLQQRFLR